MGQVAKIYFWNPDGTHADFLSQWYECRFKDSEVTYKTTEMYMMYQKAVLFGDDDTAQKILDAETPLQAKKLGREVKGFNTKIWDEHKEKIVEQGNYLKFTQADTSHGHASTYPSAKDSKKIIKGGDKEATTSDATPLKDLLLQTQDHELIEASPEDHVWGIGYTAEDAASTPRNQWGQNLLGKVLVNVRGQLMKESYGGQSWLKASGAFVLSHTLNISAGGSMESKQTK